MFQSVPIVELPEEELSEEKMFEALKGLSLDDAISKIASSVVDFSFKLLIAILIFYAGKFLIKKLYRMVQTIMAKRHVDASLSTFILSLIKMVAYFILIIIVIGIIGIETSSFLALFASAGVAIGMALSGTLQNFAGGVLILLLKPYKVGDYIEAQGYAGTVKAINIFNTIINTPDNKSIIIPNGGLSTSSVNNYSLEGQRRVDWTIGLAYNTDFDKAREVILAMLAEDSRIITDTRESFVGLNELADSSINIVVRAWTPTSDYWNLYFDMNRRFYKELPEHGFEFPFPQLDVHIGSTS
ncbi:MAG: mechanosensitive ion channel [Clostridium sp.]|nr:mechanosensitive ion channel [Prevotella sp.]MCM1429309.1 mechanosensitive ion channel [Clostridium sp.]MCM1475658.1 mechanosensitive ion channel [Muribaculaceae bacterium]